MFTKIWALILQILSEGKIFLPLTMQYRKIITVALPNTFSVALVVMIIFPNENFTDCLWQFPAHWCWTDNFKATADTIMLSMYCNYFCKPLWTVKTSSSSVKTSLFHSLINAYSYSCFKQLLANPLHAGADESTEAHSRIYKREVTDDIDPVKQDDLLSSPTLGGKFISIFM